MIRTTLKSQGTNLKFGKYVEVSFAGQRLSQVFKLPQELCQQQHCLGG